MTTLVNDAAKISVKLDPKLDGNQNTYYIGKLQFNGTLNFDDGGQSFVLFVSDEGYEELQIGPVDKSRRKSDRKNERVVMDGDKYVINLHSFRDGDKNIAYCAEVELEGLQLNMKNGFFFTIFTAIEGREQIQMTPLRHKNKFLKTREGRKDSQERIAKTA